MSVPLDVVEHYLRRGGCEVSGAKTLRYVQKHCESFLTRLLDEAKETPGSMSRRPGRFRKTAGLGDALGTMKADRKRRPRRAEVIVASALGAGISYLRSYSGDVVGRPPPGSELRITGELGADLTSWVHQWPWEMPLEPRAGRSDLLQRSDGSTVNRLGGWPLAVMSAVAFAFVDYLAIISVEAERPAPGGSRPNREMAGQGLGCIASGMGGSAPIGGSLTRSMLAGMIGCLATLRCGEVRSEENGEMPRLFCTPKKTWGSVPDLFWSLSKSLLSLLPCDEAVAPLDDEGPEENEEKEDDDEASDEEECAEEGADDGEAMDKPNHKDAKPGEDDKVTHTDEESSEDEEARDEGEEVSGKDQVPGSDEDSNEDEETKEEDENVSGKDQVPGTDEESSEDEQAQQEAKKVSGKDQVSGANEESSEDEESHEGNGVSGKDQVPGTDEDSNEDEEGQEEDEKVSNADGESSEDEEARSDQKKEDNRHLEEDEESSGDEEASHHGSQEEKHEVDANDMGDEQVWKECEQQLKLIDDIEVLEKLHETIYGEKVSGKTMEETNKEVAKEKEEEQSSQEEEIDKEDQEDMKSGSEKDDEQLHEEG
eukprot:g27445.t1